VSAARPATASRKWVGYRDRSGAHPYDGELRRRYIHRVLRRFIYLDKTALHQYVTALEGGRTTESTTRLMRTGTGAGGFDVGQCLG